MSYQQNKSSGQKFTQKLVNQGPVYDRKIKLHRPRKTGTGKNSKYL